jgi:hypothetical protein
MRRPERVVREYRTWAKVEGHRRRLTCAVICPRNGPCYDHFILVFMKFALRSPGYYGWYRTGSQDPAVAPSGNVSPRPLSCRVMEDLAELAGLVTRFAAREHRCSSWHTRPGAASGYGAKRREQVVEQGDRGVRADGGALPQRFLPPDMKGCRQLPAHPL